MDGDALTVALAAVAMQTGLDLPRSLDVAAEVAAGGGAADAMAREVYDRAGRVLYSPERYGG